MPLLSVNEYARHRNVSHQAIGKALKDGRIKKERSGKIDSEKADASWALRTDTVLSMRTMPRARVGAPSQSASASMPASQAPSDPSTFMAGMGVGEKIAVQTAMARLQLVKLQVETAQVERDKLKGSVMQTSEVRESIASIVLMVRDHMLVQPDRLAATLASVNDTATAHRILKSDVDSALKKLSKAVKTLGI